MRPHPKNPVPNLDFNRDTPARLEWVHKLQTQGYEDWGIAAILNVSDATVKRDLERIKKRINVEHDLIRHRSQLEWVVRESIGRYLECLKEGNSKEAMKWFDRVLQATSNKTRFLSNDKNTIMFVQNNNIQNNTVNLTAEELIKVAGKKVAVSEKS